MSLDEWEETGGTVICEPSLSIEAQVEEISEKEWDEIFMSVFNEEEQKIYDLKGTKSDLPKHELEILARHFLPQIQAFFESEDGREEYAAWQHEQALLKAQKANNKA